LKQKVPPQQSPSVAHAVPLVPQTAAPQVPLWQTPL